MCTVVLFIYLFKGAVSYSHHTALSGLGNGELHDVNICNRTANRRENLNVLFRGSVPYPHGPVANIVCS